MSILEEAKQKILAAPPEKIPSYANALNYSLYLDTNDPLKSFSPRQIAVRWKLTVRELMTAWICMQRKPSVKQGNIVTPGISMFLKILGVNDLSEYQISRYFSRAEYEKKFPGREISTKTVVETPSTSALVFSYAEVYHLAVEASLVQYGQNIELPEGLLDYIDNDALITDVNNRANIMRLLRESKYPDNS